MHERRNDQLFRSIRPRERKLSTSTQLITARGPLMSSRRHGSDRTMCGELTQGECDGRPLG